MEIKLQEEGKSFMSLPVVVFILTFSPEAQCMPSTIERSARKKAWKRKLLPEGEIFCENGIFIVTRTMRREKIIYALLNFPRFLLMNAGERRKMVKFMKINSLGGALDSAAFIVIQQTALLSRHLANEDLRQLLCVSSQRGVVRQAVGGEKNDEIMPFEVPWWDAICQRLKQFRGKFCAPFYFIKRFRKFSRVCEL